MRFWKAYLLMLTLAGLSFSGFGQSVFINEIHYDNNSGDTDEAIEIAGPSGTDLTGWEIILYNGNGGSEYETISLDGNIIDDETCGFGALVFYESDIQNGSPDGLALVENGTVVQFLSYEGSFTATDGPANGMTSTDIGVEEAGSTPVGNSLQLTGSGEEYTDFTWQSPSAESMGDVNAGQDFCGGCPITVNSTSPVEGPVNTTIILEGLGFNASGGISTVTVGGQTASSFTVLSGTEIEITIPAGAGSGSIELDNGDCSTTYDGFELLTATCDDFDELMISEMYNTPNDGDYIEIYNGTGNSIDLSDYAIRITSNCSGTTSLNLTGTIADGEAQVIQAGSNVYFTQVDHGPGGLNAYNDDDDYIELLFDGDPIDRIGTCGSWMTSNDVVYRSLPTRELSPSSFDENDWDIQSADTLDLGTAFTGSSSPINESQDDSAEGSPCETIDMGINFSGTSLQYQWYARGPGDDNWTALSNSLNYSGVNTTILSIDESFDLDGYQYYAEVISEGSCANYSAAIPLSVESRRYYRSRNDGNWSDVSTWEYSPDGISNWENACRVPNHILADEIAITNDVDIITTINVPKIVIENSGMLEVDFDDEIIFQDKPGADLVINGTFIDGASSGNGIRLEDSSATWALGANGTLIKTYSSSTGEYRANYDGGIINIPSTAKWVYRYDGSGDLGFASSTNSETMYYPNLVLENTAGGTYESDVNGSNEFLSDFTMVGDDPIYIKGNFEIGTTGSGFIDFVNINDFGSPVEIQGDLIVGSGSTLRNHDGAISQDGTGFSVNGEIIIDGTLDLTGGNGILALEGGSTDQEVQGSGSITVQELSVNKSMGNVMVSGISPEVRSDLNLQDGVIHIDDENDHLLLTNTASVSGSPSDASHVDGFIHKQGNSDFEFPVGDGGNIQPVSLANLGNSTTFQVRYYAETHPNAPPYYDGENYEISQCDYWTVVPTDISTQAEVTFDYGDNLCTAVSDPQFLRLASYISGVWVDPIDPGVDPDQNDPLISSLGPTTDWGDFTLSSNRGDLNVLPVNWLYFEARKSHENAELTWATGSEVNNDRFEIERSRDGIAFQKIGEIMGAGTSSAASYYSFTDDDPFEGSNYYRIRQVDHNGSSELSHVREVAFGDENPQLFVMHKPAGWTIQYSEIQGPASLSLFTSSGKLLEKRTLGNSSGSLELRASASGVYLIKILHAGGLITRKLYR